MMLNIRSAVVTVMAVAAVSLPAAQRPTVDLEALPFTPRHYLALHSASPIAVDGKLTDPAWAIAPWTEAFLDIEGDRRPQPRFRTRAKMLWDDNWFYVAAEMEEPDVWGTLTDRDSVIFRDNDFEVFIDPDGDTHAYYELEVNALGTPWDLMLIKPYRDGGPAIHAWDIAGLQARVEVKGTINRPGDRDDGWTIELALPWAILKEAAPPPRGVPKPGDRWRVNFSRVEWQVDVVEAKYSKRLQAGGKNPLPENNWVWSPQGAIDMHMPERWGYVQFAEAPGSPSASFVDEPNERVKWALRRLYYRQRSYRTAHAMFATTLDALNVSDIRVDGLDFKPVMQTTASGYEITASGFEGTTVHITHDSRVWVTR